MAEFSQLYTGRGTAVKLPSGQQFQQAGERLSDFVTKAEEIKYKVYKDNEQEFLKNSSITPEFVLADSARKNTATQIDEYNKKWAKVFQQKASTGGLSMEDKQKMATEKNWIVSQNQEDVATMARYKAMKDAVQRNPNLYSRDKFNILEAQYLNNGRFDATEPPIQAIDPVSFYSDDRNRVSMQGAEQEVQTIPVEGGKYYTKQLLAPLDQGTAKVEWDMLHNPQFREGVMEKFAGLEKSDPATFKKYLDVNKDNIVDPQERKNYNPIMQWAKDTYGESAIAVNKSQTKSVSKPSISKPSDTAENKIGVKRDIAQYGQKTFNNTFAFEKLTRNNIPTRGGEVLDGYYTGNLEAGNVSGDILDYVPGEDAIIVRGSTGFANPDVESKAILKIPAGNVIGIDDIQVMDNGRVVTIGELRKQKSNPQNGTTDVGGLFVKK